MEPTANEQEVAMSREVACGVLDVLFGEDSDNKMDEALPASENSEDEDEDLAHNLPGAYSVRHPLF